MAKRKYITVAESIKRSIRTYKGVKIVQSGLAYYVWLDYVTAPYCQPRCLTLASAKATISSAQLSH